MTTFTRDLIEHGIYHVYNRGHNGMGIFCDAADFIFYFKLIMLCQIDYGFEVFAICLMSNHFHMIIKDVGKQLPIIMDTINSVYARYFNEKYNHKGTIFDGPFKSNRVLSDYGFLRLFRYIVRNPVVAGIVNSIFDYRWVTITKELDMFNIVNFEYVNETFQKVCNVSYFDFINSDEDDLWLDDIEVHRIEDSDAEKQFKGIVYRITGASEFSSKDIDKNTQIQIISISRNIGITIRQLCKLSGFSIGKIHSMIQEGKNEHCP